MLCLLIREYGWTPDQLGNLTWSQVRALNVGLGELSESQRAKDPHELPGYEDNMATAIRKCTDDKGQVDLARAYTLATGVSL